MKHPKISIITPTLNAGQIVEKALNSVAAQDYPHIEHLIIDGMSDDNTMDVLNTFQASGHDIIVVCERDNGIYDAMNKGLQICTGEWIYFLGADDWLYDNHLLNDLHEQGVFNNEQVVYGNVLIHGDSSWASDQTIYDGPFDLEKLLKKNICHQGIFYPRSVIEKVGFYNVNYKLTADWDYNIRCFVSYQFKYTDRIIANFTSGGQSSLPDDHLMSLEFPENIIRYFKLNPNDPTLYKATSPFFYPLILSKTRELEKQIDHLTSENQQLRNDQPSLNEFVQQITGHYEIRLAKMEEENQKNIVHLISEHDQQTVLAQQAHLEATEELQQQYVRVMEKMENDYLSVIRIKETEQENTWAFLREKEKEYQEYISILLERQKEFWTFYREKEEEYQQYLQSLENEIGSLQQLLATTRENASKDLAMNEARIFELENMLDRKNQELTVLATHFDLTRKSLMDIVVEKENEVNTLLQSYTWKTGRFILRPLMIFGKSRH